MPSAAMAQSAGAHADRRAEARALLWAMLDAVEGHTVARYAAAAPELLTPGKKAARDAVAWRAAGTSLAGTPLETAVDSLLAAATGDGSLTDALLLQGLVLEQLGVTIYRTFGDGRLSDDGSDVATLAGAASEEVSALAAERLCAEMPNADARFDAFAERTDAMFVRLDALGEALDTAFSGPFGLHFEDVMGEFMADLLPACTDGLGLQRREVIVHLTHALMG